MSKIKVNSIEAATGSTITIPSGQTLDISSTTLTLPSTVVTTTGTQTLTNKTIGVSQLSGTLPVANGGTGLTTLGTAAQVLRVNSGATALEFATPVAGGITEADLFRVSTNINFNSLSSGFVISNWERADSYGFDKIGTGMSESSGVFTFPSNGVYLISWHSTGEVSGGVSSRSINVVIHYTSNNSTYAEAARGHTNDQTFPGNSSAYYAGTNFITKITDTSNQKIKFNLAEQDGDNCLLYGDTDMNLTYAYFLKLN